MTSRALAPGFQRAGGVHTERPLPDNAGRLAVDRHLRELFHVAEIDPKPAHRVRTSPPGRRRSSSRWRFPKKYFTPGSAFSLHDLSASRVIVSGAPRSGWKRTVHGPSIVAMRSLRWRGNRSRRCGGGLAEHHEHRAPRIEMERHRRAIARDAIRRRFAPSAVGVPDLGLLSAHAERCLHVFIAVLPVVDEVDIAVRQCAMDEERGRIRLRLRVSKSGGTCRRDKTASIVASPYTEPAPCRCSPEPSPAPQSSSASRWNSASLSLRLGDAHRLRPDDDGASADKLLESCAAPAATCAGCSGPARARGSCMPLGVASRPSARPKTDAQRVGVHVVEVVAIAGLRAPSRGRAP